MPAPNPAPQIASVKARQFADDLVKVLRKVPEVAESCKWMQASAEELSTIIREYARISTRLDTYGTSELKWLDRADELMRANGVRATSASTINASEFLQNRPNKHHSFGTAAAQAFNFTNNIYMPALSELADMMWRGHEMFAHGGTPRDGDPESDRVIWGHTQARSDVSPDILAHFIVSHYLGRFVSAAFAADGEHRLAANKDAFLAVLTAAVLLEETRSPGSTGSVLRVWLPSRREGGLGWISQGQLDAYAATRQP